MNKKLKNAAKDFYDRSSLTSKIRYSYLVILIPIFLFLLFFATYIKDIPTKAFS